MGMLSDINNPMARLYPGEEPSPEQQLAEYLRRQPQQPQQQPQQQMDPAMQFAQRYQAMMRQAGMLPSSQAPMPSEEDIAQATRARNLAPGSNIVRAFNGQSRIDPSQAYSDTLKARMETSPAAIRYAHEAAQAKAMRDMTSPELISYMSALAGGSSVSLPEFLAMQKSSGGPNDFQVKVQAIQQARLEEAQQTGQPPRPLSEADYYNVMRGPQMMMMGNVGFRLDPATGQPIPLATAEEVGSMAGTVASGEQSGAKIGAGEGTQIAATKDAIWGFETAYNETQSLLSNSQGWRDQIESGSIETGPINSWLYNTFGMNAGNVAGMKTAQIAQGLKDLQMTNLAPVSNVELALIMQMWANIASGKDANRATLDEAIRRTENLQSKMVAGLKTNANRLRRLAPGEWEDVNSSLGELPLKFLNAPPEAPAGYEEERTP
jgi:hypothetical protein